MTRLDRQDNNRLNLRLSSRATISKAIRPCSVSVRVRVMVRVRVRIWVRVRIRVRIRVRPCSFSIVRLAPITKATEKPG